MFAIIRTRWQTRPLSRRAKRRSSAAPGSLRKKYAGIAYPPNMVRLPNHSTTSGDPRKPVLAASPSQRETRAGDRPETMPEQHVTISRHTVETVGMAVGRSLPSGVDAQHAIRFRCSKLVPREAGCLHWRSEKDGSDVIRRSGRSGTPETRNRVPCSDVVPVRDRLEKACA